MKSSVWQQNFYGRSGGKYEAGEPSRDEKLT